MATSSDVKVKKEPGEDVKEVTHGHRFYIKFEANDNRPHEINGEDFQTVLQAIRSFKKHPAQEWSDEKLLIQREPGRTTSSTKPNQPTAETETTNFIQQTIYKLSEARSAEMTRKRKMKDIRSFCIPLKQQVPQSQSTEPGTETQSQSSRDKEPKMTTSSNVKMKKEPGEDVKEVLHNHRFNIQFESTVESYEINCKAPQTVFEAINSRKECPKWATSGEKLVIQEKVGDSEFTIATHFPCCLVKEDETLIISKREDKVEETRGNENVLPKESYSVFYIDGQGAKNTKIRDLFISSQRQSVKPLCVYGEKEITVEEALKQDGRFQPLGSFSLIDCDNKRVLQSSETIDKLRERKFKIKLLKDKTVNDPKKSKSKKGGGTASNRHTDETTAASNTAVVLASPQQRGVSVMKALESSSSDADREDIYKILRDQFPDLKQLMLSRFPADSFQNELSMREEKFGKMRQSFREFYRLEKLIRMGKSVCKVVVGDVTGTGFVLIDNFILTNAHLFKTCTDGDRLREGVDVEVLFNYENPQTGQSCPFKVEDALICSTEGELDYAVLVVNRELFKQFIQKTQRGVFQIPSGLLERVGEMPKNGEACIIGHPGGEVKQIDLTFIIEMENRDQAAGENLPQYKGKPYGLCVEQVKNQGIEKIMVGGADAEKVITYNSFMYHGASGSPVFDVDGFLCGLHTGGFYFGPEEAKEHVMEFAYPMETIIKHLVMKLREKNETGLFERMKKVAGKNVILREIFDISGSACRTVALV